MIFNFQTNQTNIFFWLKLYHKYTYKCFNVYNSNSELIAFISEEDALKFESRLGIQTPKLIKTNLLLDNQIDLSNKKHLLVDPKLPETLDGIWAEKFSIILSKNIYNSLGINNTIFKSPQNFYKNVVNNYDLNFGHTLNLGSGSNDMDMIKSGYSLLVNMDIKTLPYAKQKEKGIIGDLFNLPLKTKSFDTIFAFFLLEHISSLDKVLKNIESVLKVNGRFIFSIPFIIPENNDIFNFSINPPFFHLRVFSKHMIENENWIMSLDELDILLQSKGFKKEKHIYFQENEIDLNNNIPPNWGNQEFYAICSYIKSE